MNRSQYLLTAFGILLIIGIYQLPRSVVENEAETTVEVHDFSISDEDRRTMNLLISFLGNDKSENYSNFADSLASFYLRYGMLDSAVLIVQESVKRDSSLTNMINSINVVYSTFQRAANPDVIDKRLEVLQPLLESALVKDPNNLSLRSKKAMTMVYTQNPMAGIQMLRGIVEEDSTFREARLNLGLLSIRSSQFDRGIEWFSGILKENPEDVETKLYLSICLMETGQTDEAQVFLNEIINADAVDPAIRMAAEEYLVELE
jgi:tetratricopeptide (TPR) repeat protein